MEEKIIEPNLTSQEKVLAMRSAFSEMNRENKYIKNPADFLAKGFDKLEGFDARWLSLISSNPLLFEDTDYVRIKPYINNQITDDEKEAYKSGQLRELYPTFEHLLMSNLQQYDRIMNFCTMIFLHYIRISDEIYQDNMKNIPLLFDITPTKLWCCALSSTQSTEWELKYAWNTGNQNFIELPIKNSPKSILETSWKSLYKNIFFAKFMEFAAVRCMTTGFRETFNLDIIDNRKLSIICSKFTKTSSAISQQQLESIYDYINEGEAINNRLYISLNKCLLTMFCGDTSQFGIYVFRNEFFIHTTKFSIKVYKNDKGQISKDYLANSYQCFMAEEGLISSMNEQIEWAKYELPNSYDYDKLILQNLLQKMLESKDWRDIICVKRMNDYGILSVIKFTGQFDNVVAHEEFKRDNQTIREIKITFCKRNMAAYIINRGYYVFGLTDDVIKIMEITRKNIIQHYTNYCIPVFHYMKDVIALYDLNRNEIIDVICSGVLNPEKLNNDNIMYTNVVNPKNSDLMSQILKKQNNRQTGQKKNYWKVVLE